MQNSNINDNSISDSVVGIEFSGVNTLNISNNFVSTSTGAIWQKGNASKINILGNNLIISGNSTGLYMRGIVDRYIITENIVEFTGATTASGVRVTQGENGNISNNIIQGLIGYGVRLEATNNTIVKGNTVLNATNPSQDLGSFNLFRLNKGINDNKITGTTAQRPTSSNTDLYFGYIYIDTTLNKPIWWFSSVFKDADGVIV